MKLCNDRWHSVESFDCYMKQTLKFKARDYFRSAKKRSEYEASFSDLTDSELSSAAAFDYYSECDDCFDVSGWQVQVKNFDLAIALSDLPKLNREVILLYYFIGLTGKEIAENRGIPISTVRYHRIKALDKLKTILEDSLNG
ncbi:MAG: sigma-70 family RNA polymerase sigma factor [Oscillospiraceae bacterium]|nr:sigma-70 family RNA polymerase sigma factor [Oscillospiraceae bacterium]